MEQQTAESHTLSEPYTSDMPPINNGVHKSLHVLRRTRRRRRHPSCRQVNKMQLNQLHKVSNENGIFQKKEAAAQEEEEEDREEMERKIEALQRIVPGGESFGVDELFDETGGYIVALQYQVKTLRALTAFFGKLEKEKTKFGG